MIVQIASIKNKKSLSQISPNVKKDEFYLDPVKAENIIGEIIANFQLLEKSFTGISEYLNEIVRYGQIDDVYIKTFKIWSKKSKSQAQEIRFTISKLKKDFEYDTINFALQVLSSKLDELESQVNLMSNS